MTVSRLLILVAVVLFALTALSAFSDDVNVNETGWLALGLTAWAASSLTVGMNFGGGLGGRRRRVLR
jgi:hypothetical protein